MGSLPEQVRLQAERANQIHRQVYAPEDKPEDTPEDKPEGSQESEQQPQTGAPETPQQPPVDDKGAADPQAAPPDPAADPNAAKDDKPEDWEQRYRTAQGLLKAESQRHAAERRQLLERIEELEKKFEQGAAAKPAEPAQPLITDKDLETYGPELLDVIGRKAQEMAAQIVEQRMAELKPQLEQTKEQVDQFASQVYKSSEQRFYGELERVVPDWQAINADQRWLAWLGEVDPISGVPRQQHLDHAAQQLDHARVAMLFNTFKQAAGIETPAAPASPAPAAAPAPKKPEISPTPRSVGNASAPTHREPELPSVSRAEINAHYRRSSAEPQYRNSEEYKAMEQRIASAMAAGQVT